MNPRRLPRLVDLASAVALTAVVGMLAATQPAAPTTLRADSGTAPARDAGRTRAASVTPVRIAAPVGGRVARAVRLAPRRTADFAMVGVTWDATPEPVTVEVRTLGRGGWTAWQRLEAHETGGEGGRAASDPLWVGSAHGVAARVTAADGSVPAGVRVELVDPGVAPAAQDALAPAADGSPSYTAKPAMVSRSSWGARRARSCDQPRVAEQTKGIVFHHTAGSNGYTRAAAPRIVRSIQAYHMDGQGWCDIGYNFLVDRFGRIFEGRSGGVLYPVRGAHAGNFEVNTYSTGVSMMANLQTARPSTAMKNATVRLVGWRLGTNYLNATSTWTVDGHALRRISGHRQVYAAGIRPATQTACPGRYGYSWMLDGLRPRVARYIASYSTPIKKRYLALGRATTGPVSVGEYTSAGGRKTRFTRGDLIAKGASAYWVSGPIQDYYDGLRAQTGRLGFPLGDAVRTETGSRQRFEGATLIYTASTGRVTEG